MHWELQYYNRIYIFSARFLRQATVFKPEAGLGRPVYHQRSSCHHQLNDYDDIQGRYTNPKQHDSPFQLPVKSIGQIPGHCWPGETVPVNSAVACLLELFVVEHTL